MPTTRPVTWELPEDLLAAVEREAQRECLSPESLVSQLLSRQLATVGSGSAARCSVRTGLNSAGPSPLPLQQD